MIADDTFVDQQPFNVIDTLDIDKPPLAKTSFELAKSLQKYSPRVFV